MAFMRRFMPLGGHLGRSVSVMAEATPNPKSMKFVLEGGEALAAPLAKSLLKVDGVREVLLAAEHVTVTKATLADWEELQDIAADAFRAFGVPSQVLDFAARLPIP
eukprot:g26972.t1